MINFDVLIAKVIIAIFGSFLLVQSKGIFGSNIVPLSDKILFVIIFTSLALYEIYYIIHRESAFYPIWMRMNVSKIITT